MTSQSTNAYDDDFAKCEICAENNKREKEHKQLLEVIRSLNLTREQAEQILLAVHDSRNRVAREQYRE